jgi:Peptidase family M50
MKSAPMKTRRRRTVGSVLLLPIAYLFLLAAGPVISAGAETLVPGRGLTRDIVMVILLVCVFFSTVVVHEIGHAFAMQRLRWPVHMIAVFPVAYHTKTGRLTWWAGLDGDIGGLVTTSPPALRPLWTDMVVYGAGPLANFACAAIMLPIVALLRIPVIEATLGSFGAASFLLAIGNLVPFKTWRGTASDGARILTVIVRYADDIIVSARQRSQSR